MKRYYSAIAAFGICIPGVLNAQDGRVYDLVTPLPEARQMYGTAVVNDYLYVIGGHMASDLYTASVIKAPVRNDGSLGDWEATTPLPASRSYINNTTLAMGDALYVVQGLDGHSESKFRTIIWAKQGTNGHLEPWQESEPCFGSGVSCSVAVAAPGYIHLIGGSVGESTPTNKVWQAKVEPDGAVSGWSEGPELPTNLWFHHAGVVQNKVYVWGGLNGSANTQPNLNIFMSNLAADGQLTEWQTLSVMLDEGQYSGACTASGNFLLTFCPRYPGGGHSGDVWYSIVGPDGPAKWVKREYDLAAKLYVAVATDKKRGTVYLPGGRLSKDVNLGFDNQVYSFPLAVGKRPTEVAKASAAVQSVPPSASSQLMNVALKPETLTVAEPAPTVPAQRLEGFLSFKAGQEMIQNYSLPYVLYLHKGDPLSTQAQLSTLTAFDAKSYVGKVIFVDADVDETQELAPQYTVTSGPLWLFFDAHGNRVVQKNGVLQVRDLEAALLLIAGE